MSALVFLVIAALYFYFSARDRTNTVVGAAVLVPFNQYLPTLGIPFANVHTLLLFGLAWGVLRTPNPPLGQRKARPPRALALFALILVAGYVHGGLAAGFSRDLFVLFKEKISVLFFCFAAFKIADNPKGLQRVFWGCLLGAGAEVLFCFLEYLLRTGNVTGHLETRNATGAFLATYTTVYLGNYLVHRSNPRGRWFLLAVAVGTIAIMGTNSRGGVVALGATFLLVLLVKNRTLFVAVLVAVLTYEAWMPQRLLRRFETVDAEAESGGTLARRVRIWEAGFSVFVHRPLGVGLNRFAPAIATYSDDHAVVTRWGGGRAAHNEIVLVAVEFGIQGVTVLVWLLGSMAARALRIYRRDEDVLIQGLGLGAACGLLGGFLASMSLTLLMRSDISGVLWILLGLCARRSSEIGRKASPDAVQLKDSLTRKNTGAFNTQAPARKANSRHVVNANRDLKGST
jgi:hypothetical protein